MSVRPTWRVIDTGLRGAAENIALNRALLTARQQRHIPNTLRFLRFTPSALIGFHQSAAQELRLDYCAEHGIAIQRRITGGGAIYFDETQLGWELYLDRAALGTADMLAIARRICEAAARGISRLGIDARFRPRNDIEVDGRKISGTGGAFDGDAILYQGTLLIEFDVERMLRVLRIPAEKLSDKAIASARARVANLKDLLGAVPSLADIQATLTAAFAEAFGVDFAPAALSDIEEALFADALREIDSPEWVQQHSAPAAAAPVVRGMHKAAGGLIYAALLLDTARGRIKQAWFTGDFFVNPKRMAVDLEAALRDTPLATYADTIDRFFADYPVEMLLLQRDDFTAAVADALRNGAPDAADAHA